MNVGVIVISLLNLQHKHRRRSFGFPGFGGPRDHKNKIFCLFVVSWLNLQARHSFGSCGLLVKYPLQAQAFFWFFCPQDYKNSKRNFDLLLRFGIQSEKAETIRKFFHSWVSLSASLFVGQRVGRSWAIFSS